MSTTVDDRCVDCYKIICNACGWEANNDDVLQIKKGELTTCPECGWSPTTNK